MATVVPFVTFNVQNLLQLTPMLATNAQANYTTLG